MLFRWNEWIPWLNFHGFIKREKTHVHTHTHFPEMPWTLPARKLCVNLACFLFNSACGIVFSAAELMKTTEDPHYYPQSSEPDRFSLCPLAHRSTQTSLCIPRPRSDCVWTNISDNSKNADVPGFSAPCSSFRKDCPISSDFLSSLTVAYFTLLY